MRTQAKKPMTTRVFAYCNASMSIRTAVTRSGAFVFGQRVPCQRRAVIRTTGLQLFRPVTSRSLVSMTNIHEEGIAVNAETRDAKSDPLSRPDASIDPDLPPPDRPQWVSYLKDHGNLPDSITITDVHSYAHLSQVLDSSPTLSHEVRHLTLDGVGDFLNMARLLAPLHSLTVDYPDHQADDDPLDVANLRDDLPQVYSLTLVGDATPCYIWNDLQQIGGVAEVSVQAKWAEDADITHMPAHWPVRTLTLSGICDSVGSPHLLNLTSLKLDYCCSIQFDYVPPTETARLRDLVIIENDAMDHFIMMTNKTCLTRNLRSLRIQSTNGCDFSHEYDVGDFARALKQSTSITSLDLEVFDSEESLAVEEGPPFADLPAFLPPNLRILRFVGPPWLTTKMDRWMECAADSRWLPNLTSVTFGLVARGSRDKDPVVNDAPLRAETARAAQEASARFIQQLRAHRPSVVIHDGWHASIPALSK